MTTKRRPLAITTQLAELLNERGHVTQILPADPPDQPADGINIWSPEEPYARYPVTTVYAPTSNSLESDWAWGNHFEHTAPGLWPLEDVAKAVSATCQTPRP